MRKRFMVAFFAVALFIAGIAGPAKADSVISIDVGDINVLNDVDVAVIVPIVVALCPNINVDVIEVVVGLIANNETDQKTMCTTVSGPVKVYQGSAQDTCKK
jgi:hypothetical protein